MRFNTVAPASVSIIATQGEGGALLPYVSKVGGSVLYYNWQRCFYLLYL